MNLNDLIERAEGYGWNWELSRKGKNPDGTWQYWAVIWHPRRSSPQVSELGSSPANAMHAAISTALNDQK